MKNIAFAFIIFNIGILIMGTVDPVGCIAAKAVPMSKPYPPCVCIRAPCDCASYPTEPVYETQPATV